MYKRQDAQHLRIVVAGLVGVLGVDVDDVVVGPGERLGGEHVVQDLGVALVDVAVALGPGQPAHLVGEHPAGGEVLQGGGELVVVEVAGDDHLGLGVLGQQILDESVDQLRLRGALDLRAAGRRLEAAVEALVAALGVEVVGDHEHPAARTALERELPDQRLAAGLPRRVGGRDTARGRGQRGLAVVGDDLHRRGGVAALDVGEPHPLGVEEERDPDVAAGLPAVLVVDRVDLPRLVGRTARRLDRVGELLQRGPGGDRSVVLRAAVVLDLLQCHHVRRGQVLHQRLRQPVELGLRGRGGEVLDVVRGHGQLVGLLPAGGLRGRTVAGQRTQRGGLDGVAAEVVVVQRPGGGPGQLVADIGLGERVLGEGDQRLDLDPAAVGVRVRAVEHPAAGGAVVVRIGGDPQLVMGVGGADDGRVDDRDPHALQGLVAVQGVLAGPQGERFDALAARVGSVSVRYGGRVELERSRQRGLGGGDLPGGAGDFGDGLEAGVLAAGVVLADRTADGERVADLHIRRLFAGVDEDGLAGGVVGVGVRVL